MKISAFDTGITTGIVLVDIDEDKFKSTVLETLEANENDLSYVSDKIVYVSDLVLVEQTPYFVDPALKIIQGIVTHDCEIYKKTVKFIYPGLWKPFAKARKWNKTVSSQHIQDAYNMLRYEVFFRFFTELKDLEIK